MASLNERLLDLYPENKPQSSPSWIPKRPHHLDPVDKFRKDLAQEMAEKAAMEEEAQRLGELMDEAIEEIFVCVEDLFESKLGQGQALENRIYNFTMSWNSQFQRHGPKLVWAIGEMTEEMNFVNHAGFIRIDLVKAKINEIEKRTKRH